MKRLFLGLLGAIQILLSVGLSLMLWFWFSAERPYWLGTTTASFIGSVALVALTIASGAISGLRLLGWSRVLALRWVGLARLSYVLTPVVLGLLVADIYRTETQPFHTPPELAAVGKPFPLKFTAFDGQPVDLAALKGKVVLLNYWATWCGPCVHELPELRALYSRWHAQGVEIIGISCDSDATALRTFLKANPLPWPTYFDGQGFAHNIYRAKYTLRGIPQLWLIDKQGLLCELDVAGNDDAMIARYLRQ